MWGSNVVVAFCACGRPDARERKEGGHDDRHHCVKLGSWKNPVGDDAEDSCVKVSSRTQNPLRCWTQLTWYEHSLASHDEDDLNRPKSLHAYVATLTDGEEELYGEDQAEEEDGGHEGANRDVRHLGDQSALRVVRVRHGENVPADVEDHANEANHECGGNGQDRQAVEQSALDGGQSAAHDADLKHQRQLDGHDDDERQDFESDGLLQRRAGVDVVVGSPVVVVVNRTSSTLR